MARRLDGVSSATCGAGLVVPTSKRFAPAGTRPVRSGVFDAAVADGVGSAVRDRDGRRGNPRPTARAATCGPRRRRCQPPSRPRRRGTGRTTGPRRPPPARRRRGLPQRHPQPGVRSRGSRRANSAPPVGVGHGVAYWSISSRPASLSTTRTSTPSRSSRRHGRMPAGCSRSVRTTTSPGSQSSAVAMRLMPSVVLGSGDVGGVSPDMAGDDLASRRDSVPRNRIGPFIGGCVEGVAFGNAVAASTTGRGVGPLAPVSKYVHRSSAGIDARSSTGSMSVPMVPDAFSPV